MRQTSDFPSSLIRATWRIIIIGSRDADLTRRQAAAAGPCRRRRRAAESESSPARDSCSHTHHTVAIYHLSITCRPERSVPINKPYRRKCTQATTCHSHDHAGAGRQDGAWPRSGARPVPELPTAASTGGTPNGKTWANHAMACAEARPPLAFCCAGRAGAGASSTSLTS